MIVPRIKIPKVTPSSSEEHLDTACTKVPSGGRSQVRDYTSNLSDSRPGTVRMNYSPLHHERVAKTSRSSRESSVINDVASDYESPKSWCSGSDAMTLSGRNINESKASNYQDTYRNNSGTARNSMASRRSPENSGRSTHDNDTYRNNYGTARNSMASQRSSAISGKSIHDIDTGRSSAKDSSRVNSVKGTTSEIYRIGTTATHVSKSEYKFNIMEYDGFNDVIEETQFQSVLSDLEIPKSRLKSQTKHDRVESGRTYSTESAKSQTKHDRLESGKTYSTESAKSQTKHDRLESGKTYSTESAKSQTKHDHVESGRTYSTESAKTVRSLPDTSRTYISEAMNPIDVLMETYRSKTEETLSQVSSKSTGTSFSIREECEYLDDVPEFGKPQNEAFQYGNSFMKSKLSPVFESEMEYAQSPDLYRSNYLQNDDEEFHNYDTDLMDSAQSASDMNEAISASLSACSVDHDSANMGDVIQKYVPITHSPVENVKAKKKVSKGQAYSEKRETSRISGMGDCNVSTHYCYDVPTDLPSHMSLAREMMDTENYTRDPINNKSKHMMNGGATKAKSSTKLPPIKYNNNQAKTSLSDLSVASLRSEKSTLDKQKAKFNNKTSKAPAKSWADLSSVRSDLTSRTGATLLPMRRSIQERKAEQERKAIQTIMAEDDDDRLSLYSFVPRNTGAVLGKSVMADSKLKNGRKSMSFSNGRVWDIERANKALLERVSNIKRVASIPGARVDVPRNKPVKNKESSVNAIHRKQMQHLIASENMQMIERIRAAKPQTNTRWKAG